MMTTKRNGFTTHYFLNICRINEDNPDYYILSIYNGKNS